MHADIPERDMHHHPVMNMIRRMINPAIVHALLVMSLVFLAGSMIILFPLIMRGAR
jgi:hypothetical protein